MKFLAYLLVLGGGGLVLLLLVSWWVNWIGIYQDPAILRDRLRKSVIGAVPVLLFFAALSYLRNASLPSLVTIEIGLLVFMLLFLGACTIYLRR